MPSIAELMARSHHACDELLERAKDAAGDWIGTAVAQRALHGALEHHMATEERVLFTAFEHHSGMAGTGPTQAMRAKLGELRSLLEALSGAARDRNQRSYLRIADALSVLLRVHNANEERTLYPMIDVALGDRAAELIAGCDDAPHRCPHERRTA
jgi:hemerythrin-like domain-containing protein